MEYDYTPRGVCSSCREDGTSVSKRMEIKNLIKELKKTNPYIEKNIFKSVENAWKFRNAWKR